MHGGDFTGEQDIKLFVVLRIEERVHYSLATTNVLTTFASPKLRPSLSSGYTMHTASRRTFIKTHTAQQTIIITGLPKFVRESHQLSPLCDKSFASFVSSRPREAGAKSF